jgi:hypothetical protein
MVSFLRPGKLGRNSNSTLTGNSAGCGGEGCAGSGGGMWSTLPANSCNVAFRAYWCVDSLRPSG